ncbi:STAS-like domain-containing protein [Gracilimonas sp. Q87]|uniref:STAS-like domain-containing protein n=1 Tax=Gracilimonas sp. Q87 TaxID=3384766 RepID=UPI0039840A6B
MKIKLSEYGKTLGPRVLGVKIKNELLGKIENVTEIQFDLTEVKSLSTGFCKELFGELYIEMGEDFKSKVKFKLDGAENNERLLKIINRGISSSIQNRDSK